MSFRRGDPAGRESKHSVGRMFAAKVLTATIYMERLIIYISRSEEYTGPSQG